MDFGTFDWSDETDETWMDFGTFDWSDETDETWMDFGTCDSGPDRRERDRDRGACIRRGDLDVLRDGRWAGRQLQRGEDPGVDRRPCGGYCRGDGLCVEGL